MRLVLFSLCLFFSAISSAVKRDTINIREFGVCGTDKMDDTKQFDKAVDYIAKNGGVLYVPNGNYYLDNKKRNRQGVNNNSYIFLIRRSIKIIFESDAILYYKNEFKGFRFRTVNDINENTDCHFTVEIEGGNINGKYNTIDKEIKNNPEIWGFIGETLQLFKVTNLNITDLSCTAGIASYLCKQVEINNNIFNNVTGNPNDMIDNHGDAVYVSNTMSYEIKNNRIINTVTRKNRIGRIGICIEFEKSEDGSISSNTISGYDRGIHIELIRGTANITDNVLRGNSSGIVLWNNNGCQQMIEGNIITNNGLCPESKPILYTSSPILLLGYNTNNNTIIRNNKIEIDNSSFIPDDLLQITSSGIKVFNNTFEDKTGKLSLSAVQGKSNLERVWDIEFKFNKVSCKNFFVYDGVNISVEDNILEIKEGVLSFDNSSNYFRNNKLVRQANIKVFGKYRK